MLLIGRRFANLDEVDFGDVSDEEQSGYSGGVLEMCFKKICI